VLDRFPESYLLFVGIFGNGFVMMKCQLMERPGVLRHTITTSFWTCFWDLLADISG
jgi:hypothetical protein